VALIVLCVLVAWMAWDEWRREQQDPETQAKRRLNERLDSQ